MNPSAPSAPSASPGGAAGGIPAWGSTPDYQTQLTNSVAALAPLAPTWNGAQNGVAVGQTVTKSAPSSASTDILPQFWNKVTSVVGESASILGTGAHWAGTQLVNAAEAPIQYGAGVANAIVDKMNVDSLSAQTQELTQRQDTILQAYKSGQLSKADYVKALGELNQDWSNVSSQLSAFESKTSIDQKNFTLATVGTEVDLLSLMTGGAASGASSRLAGSLGAGLSTSELVAANVAAADTISSAVGVMRGAAMISQLASSEADWTALSPLAQQVMRQATTQALTTAAKSATAAQITRAAAADILLKFPLYYNALDSSGVQVYNELNQNKYGDAVKTIAFNAALLLSGGPIGWGLKQGGKLAQSAAVALGLRPGSILDELSRQVGNGDPLALGKIASQQVKAGNEAEVRAMIVGLESNLKAAGGNPSLAVNRIVDHLQNYIGWGDLKGMTPQQLWDNMVNYWKHADGLQQLKAEGKIAGMAADDSRMVVPLRFTTQDKNAIAAAVTQPDLPLADVGAGASSGAQPVDMTGAPDFLQPSEKTAASDLTQSSGFTRPAEAANVTSTADLKLPKGYTTDKFGSIYDASGKELTTGQIQDLLQNARGEGYLSQFEKASREGDQATMDRIVAEHPGDQRLRVPESEKQWMIARRLQAWEQFKGAHPNTAVANNPNVDKQITNLIKTISDPQELNKAINNIPTEIGLSGIPKDYAAQMAKDGYVAGIPASHNLPVVPFAETSGKLATRGAQAGDFFVRAGAPVPILKSVGAFLVNTGLSPEQAQQTVQSVFTQHFNEAAKSFGFLSADTSKGEQTILSELYNYMKNPVGSPVKVFGHVLPITDLRQLTKGDIMRAIPNITREDATTIQSAIMQAYLDVPRSITGLGNKVLDRSFQINPIGRFAYSRIQGAGRFAWNPVFMQAKLPIKAEILAQMETGGKFPTIAGTNRFMSLFFPGQYKELNAIVDNPDFKTLLPGGLGGEAESAVTGVPTLATNTAMPRTALLPVAGLVQSMAEHVGLDSATFIKEFPTQVQDAATALLHYDRNNSFLNSPLTRTLNMVFFPFRFNVKVTSFMASFLAKQAPAIQYAAIKGMMGMNSWVNSPQGQAWYSQNSDAITLFQYLSPLETISTISAALGLQHDSVAQYGELGGLPFGWIPQALDAAGVTHFGQAYVNPKTGIIAKDYIPTSAYGAVNAALQDLLGSLFTYPGATAGLPSKGSLVRAVTGQILPGSSNDFKAVTPPNVTPQEQQFSQVVQQANGTAPASATTTNTPQTTPGISVPQLSTPLNTALPKKIGGSAARKKKADYTPYLLPGQTKLGQL